MKSRPIHRQIRPTLHLANVVFLTFLLANLVMPAGWVHRAVLIEQSVMADPPVTPPPPWPFGDTFVEDTLVDTHETLFGPAEPGAHTAAYPMTAVVADVGQYTGFNNVGQPFNLNVIRHFQYTHEEFAKQLTPAQLAEITASRTQTGLFWDDVDGSRLGQHHRVLDGLAGSAGIGIPDRYPSHPSADESRLVGGRVYSRSSVSRNYSSLAIHGSVGGC